MANLIFDLNGPKLWIELNDETFKCLTSRLSKKEVTSQFIDLSRITPQWANTKKWGRGLSGKFHTNLCILSTWASSWCLCLQECGKGLLVSIDFYWYLDILLYYFCFVQDIYFSTIYIIFMHLAMYLFRNLLSINQLVLCLWFLNLYILYMSPYYEECGELICEHTNVYITNTTVQQAAMCYSSVKLLYKIPLVDWGGEIPQQGYRRYKLSLHYPLP